MFEQMIPEDDLKPRRQGGVPLHRQVENTLRRLAGAREYAEGALFPDEVTLAAKLGVSRGTVRAAIARLVTEGLLERKAGVGTRVIPVSSESAIAAWRSFSREMERSGLVIRMFRCELAEVSAPARIAAMLGINEGDTIQRLDRVRGWNGVPVLRSRSWFHPRVSFVSPPDWTRPLYDEIAAQFGIFADHARESFLAQIAGPELGRDLRIDASAPLLFRQHTVFDAQERPFEHAEIHYVSERFALTLDLKREKD